MPPFESGRVVGTPDGSEPAYHPIAETWFEGEEQMQSSLGTEEGEAALDDLQNFATGGARIFASEAEA